MGLGDLVQKAMYLGIGVASYAGEKAGEKLGELRIQVQKLADEMVERGEMSAEDARKFVDDMVNRAQQTPSVESNNPKPSEPRKIEILDDDDEEPTASASAPQNSVEEMRRQVTDLQEELRRLKRD
ncbi:phasin family protein [Phormidesmis priestleyi]